MRLFPDGLELNAGMASPMLVTHREEGWVDLDGPRVVVCEGLFGAGGRRDAPAAGPDPAVLAGVNAVLETAGARPAVVLAAGFDSGALAALVVRKLRGVAAAAAATDGPGLAAAAELCGAEAVAALDASKSGSAWGGARRVVMTRGRTWVWSPGDFDGWGPAGQGAERRNESVGEVFAEFAGRVAQAVGAPFGVPVADCRAPALPGAGFLSGSGPAGPFDGRIALLGSPLTAADAPALAGLAREALSDRDCFVLAVASTEPGALEALAGSLGPLAGRVLVGALAGYDEGQDLAVTTAGVFAAPELMITAATLRARDLGTFSGGRVSDDGLRLTGTAEPQHCSGRLRELNRDYLLAGTDEERATLVERCERLAAMLDPDEMLEYLRGAARGRW